MLNKLKSRFFGKVRNTKSQSVWDNSVERYIRDNFKIYWETLPVVAQYQFKCMTGDENKDYITYTIDYIKENVGVQDLRGLSIGCGEAVAPEMTLFETGYFSQFEVMDVAEGLLKRQNQIALDRGLRGIIYRKQDLNYVTLQRDAYDLIWAVGTIHHIENLESFFEQARYALKDNGILVMREYVGPNRLQLSDEQLSIVNEILSLLPDKYKMTPYGHIKNVEVRVDIDELTKLDPSEAVRSEDILPIMQREFEIVHFANTGGTVLHPLLNGIASNFEKDQEGEAILRIIILLERMVIEGGILPSDYVFCIAKKKS